MQWQPTKIELVEVLMGTSMGTVRVRTDEGIGFLKTAAGGEGPHPLACELVGTVLAAWLGLTTLDYTLFELDGSIDIPLANGRTIDRGTVFMTRGLPGTTWSGEGALLEALANPGDLIGMVVFDTWTRNCDRYRLRPGEMKPRQNFGNVFLSEEGAEPGRYRLVAMDHTHCFTCGGEISRRLIEIDATQCDLIYGLFPQFQPYIQAAEAGRFARRLAEFPKSVVEDAVVRIPDDWEVGPELRAYLCQHVEARAAVVSDNIVRRLSEVCVVPEPGAT